MSHLPEGRAEEACAKLAAGRRGPLPSPAEPPPQHPSPAGRQAVPNYSDPEVTADSSRRRLAEALAQLPELGTVFHGFQLVAELGRGAFGRVYLARQGDLANRFVALKVAVQTAGEAHALAQMQHTNIVPIYSVHHVPPFDAVCMPYYGATTLADVLEDLRARDAVPSSGVELFSTLHRRQRAVQQNEHTVQVRPRIRTASPAHRETVPRPLETPEALMLRSVCSLSYVDAVLWTAARVAAGLAHAHDRGILHHDLKPANILLSDDGEPMLLDFNVAEDTKQPVRTLTAYVGGTLPYMAPEHLRAMSGQPCEMDARSDLYSLGVILYELLTCRAPFVIYHGATPGELGVMIQERSKQPPRLRFLNPAVSPAAEAIVRRCLEPDPARRYPSARQLQEDLERQLAHLPLRHASDPSALERGRKWIRRHPRLASSTSVGVMAAILLVALTGLGLLRNERLAHLEARERGLQKLRAFQEDRDTAQFYLYARLTDPADLRAGVTAARRALDHFQVVQDPAWREQAAIQALADEQQDRLSKEFAELLLLLARAKKEESANPVRLQEALTWAENAERIWPTLVESPAYWRLRAELSRATGDEATAGDQEAHAATLPLQSARDYYWAASDHVLAGRHREALPLLRSATRLEPRNFWAWFILGACYDRVPGQEARAEACYSTCISLWPDFPWTYFNLGLVHARQQDYVQAIADFDAVLALRPDITDAYINRALARQNVHQAAEAIEDLTRALENGATDTRIYFLRARLKERLKDAEGAKRDFAEGLRRQPSDEKSWIARGLARLTHDAPGALDDFNQALQANPRSAAALQNKAHVLSERLRRPLEAIAVLDNAVALYPDAVLSRCGRGVLHARIGQRDAALADAEQSLRRDTSPPRLYQAACIYALTSKQEPSDRLHAYRLLSSALRMGYGFDLLETDRDLDPLRDQPEFSRLVEAERALRSNAGSQVRN